MYWTDQMSQVKSAVVTNYLIVGTIKMMIHVST